MKLSFLLSFMLISFSVLSSTSMAQVAAPAAAAAAVPAGPATFWQFMGIPQGVKKVQGALTNRRGNHPKIEPKNALKALNDPANLLSENKAIKKAAEVKVQEDLKQQKIKAIKYLTSIACGCYDKDGAVTAALVASADDCTEEVRLATMNGIQAASQCKSCNNCGQVCCCSEKVMKKLAESAYEKDEHGCYKEASKRVRDAAAAALMSCCPNREPPCITEEEPYIDNKNNSGKNSSSSGTEGTGNSKKPGTEGNRNGTDRNIDDSELKGIQDRTFFRGRQSLPPVVSAPKVDSRIRTVANRSVMDGSEAEFEMFGTQHEVANPDGGVVISFNEKTKVAHVHFTNRDMEIHPGSRVYAKAVTAEMGGFRGQWEIVSANRGCVKMRPASQDDQVSVIPGDHVFAGEPPVVVVPASARIRR